MLGWLRTSPRRSRVARLGQVLLWLRVLCVVTWRQLRPNHTWVVGRALCVVLGVSKGPSGCMSKGPRVCEWPAVATVTASAVRARALIGTSKKAGASAMSTLRSLSQSLWTQRLWQFEGSLPSHTRGVKLLPVVSVNTTFSNEFQQSFCTTQVHTLGYTVRIRALPDASPGSHAECSLHRLGLSLAACRHLRARNVATRSHIEPREVAREDALLVAKWR